MLSIDTQRLVLRRPVMPDLQPLTEMWTDPLVARFMDDFGPRDAVGVGDWLTALMRADEHGAGERPSSVQLTLVRRTDHAVVGWLGLGNSSRSVAEWDFGYALRPDHRGHGYASEALSAALAACHRRFGIASFWGECHETNYASAHVMISVGMIEIIRGDDGQRRFVYPPERAYFDPQ